MNNEAFQGKEESDVSPHIQQALEQANKAVTLSAPNPRVGCIIVSKNGEIIGLGHTQEAGGPHAEIMALQDAKLKKKSVVGSTVYVTLEPCAHYGRTGPCCDALIEAKVAKVVASLHDPNPLVSGKGFQRLRSAGITVDIGPGSKESRELNLGFFSRMIRKRPWVRLKVAASLDGVTALNNGNSQWITSKEAREDGHIWRSRSSTILTGSGTILKDNPRLDVRLGYPTRQPDLAIIDSQLKTPTTANIFETKRKIYIYTANLDPIRKLEFESRGVNLIYAPTTNNKKINLQFVLQDLASREVNELHVEAGEGLNGALILSDLIDEYLIYLAPIIIGEGKGIGKLPPLAGISEAKELFFSSIERIGRDIRILARTNARDEF